MELDGFQYEVRNFWSVETCSSTRLPCTSENLDPIVLLLFSYTLFAHSS
uniref:Uncharacterized protein n=1 Tax=Rhizophora mucronata TaxID=61149 RepID=A0A2P2JNF1_RHIMU